MVKRNYIAASMAALLLFTSALPTYAETIDEQKAKLEKVQEQLKEKETEKESSKQQVAGAIEQLMAAQKQLAAAKKELNTVEDQRNEVEDKIEKTQDNIEKTQQKYDSTKLVYSKRLREIYINGQVNYVDVLLGAKDFSDFSSRMYLLRRIIAKDINILDTLDSSKIELETQQAALADDKKALDEVHKDVEEKKKVVEEKTAERQALYDKALAEQQRIDNEYNELLAASNTITDMIKNLERGGTMGAVHGSGRFMWPITGEITSYYGWRTHPIFHTQRYHSGMDIAADTGDSILAADSGTVIEASWIGGYGNCVMIDHGGGLVTVYGHNSALVVSPGQPVQKGQLIARAGSTGYSTGPHCHFEVRLHGEVVDPLNYLP